MTTHPSDPLHQAQRELAAWHATHPDATLAEIEATVEEQLDRVRAQLIAERTEAKAGETHPVCQECGATMEPRSTATRTLLLRGDQPLELERSYVTCPTCGAGLFPSDGRSGIKEAEPTPSSELRDRPGRRSGGGGSDAF